MYFTQEVAGKLYVRVRQTEGALAVLRTVLTRVSVCENYPLPGDDEMWICPCSICRAHVIIDGVLNDTGR